MAVADWTENPYPLPRSKRSVPAGTPPPPGDLEPARAPRTRFWSYHLRVAAQNASSVTSPRFRGPAILKDMTGSCVMGDNSPLRTTRVEVYIAAAPRGAINQQPVTTIFPGANISDATWGEVIAPDAGLMGPGFLWRGDGTAAQMFRQPLDLVVYDAEFWVTIAVRDDEAANVLTLEGTLRVYEDCDQDALVLLMG